MTEQLGYGTVVETSTLPLAPAEVSGILSGEPRIAQAETGVWNGIATGVWEITPGVVSDVELDELFVVLSGKATVEVKATVEREGTTFTIAAGDFVRLYAGMQTVWTIHETLRKVYFIGS
jgi:uncharacterized protein